MPSLNELIEKIEAAGEGSRELDAAIDELFTDELGFRPLAFFKQEITIGKRRPLPFTTSIDAAMTLVPTFISAAEVRSRQNRAAWIAALSFLDSVGQEVAFESKRCATPALALCAAALKARQEDNNHAG